MSHSTSGERVRVGETLDLGEQLGSLDGAHELVGDGAEEVRVLLRDAPPSRRGHHLELSPGLAVEDQGDRQARLLAEPPQELSLPGVALRVVDGGDHAPALAHQLDQRGIFLDGVGLVLRKALLARPELAHVHERAHNARLHVPAADGERCRADRLQGSLRRQLEDFLEPVRARRHRGDVDQRAKLRVGKIPFLHGPSGLFVIPKAYL
jgi:hypothetical protein